MVEIVPYRGIFEWIVHYTSPLFAIVLSKGAVFALACYPPIIFGLRSLHSVWVFCFLSWLIVIAILLWNEFYIGFVPTVRYQLSTPYMLMALGATVMVIQSRIKENQKGPE